MPRKLVRTFAASVFGIALLMPAFVFAQDGSVDALESDLNRVHAEIEASRAQLEEQRDSVDSLEDQYDFYLSAVAVQQAELERLYIEIDATQEEITHTNNAITRTKEKQVRTADALAQAVRGTYTAEQQNIFEILFSKASLAGFIQQLRAQAEVSEEIARLSNELQEHKRLLDAQHMQLQEHEQLLESQVAEVELRKQSVEQQLAYVQEDLEDSESALQSFKQLVAQAERERNRLKSAIAEAQAGEQPEEPVVINTADFALMWPVSSRVITCEFMCASYPFDWEHGGTDIGVPSGTPVYAAEDGYVSQRQFDGTSTTTGWVYIDHKNGFETLYLHLREIVVDPYQYVEKGQLIGYSGGAKGEPGAGVSTGPHLHFEVRIDGFPANAINYLP